jgi:nucleotide-binding universal stress UspA family protein
MGLGMVVLSAAQALAALGSDESSVASDVAHLRAQARGASSTAAGYVVHEMQLPSGTLVREYVGPAGKVFAVSWDGPTKPDLHSLLGAYFAPYVDAASASPRGAAARRHFEVRQADLIVQSSGRMRAFSGRAYVPSLLPPNVSPGDIH